MDNTSTDRLSQRALRMLLKTIHVATAVIVGLITAIPTAFIAGLIATAILGFKSALMLTGAYVVVLATIRALFPAKAPQDDPRQEEARRALDDAAEGLKGGGR